MEKILNQSEIDALFKAARDRVPRRAQPAERDKPVTPCDFRRAGLITADELRAINMLHDTFVRSLTRSLAAYLRMAFEVNLVSTEQLTYGEFLQHVPEVSYVASVHLRPFDAVAVVELDSPLAFSMIDLLLGGPGEPVAVVREVTEVEEEILKGVVQLICRELQTAWQPIVGAEFQFEERQRQTQIPHLMPPNEKILSLSYEVRTSAVSGMLITAFPALVASALAQKLSQQASHRWHRAGTGGGSTLREKLQKCSFPVELILPGGTVGSRQLLELQEGRILPLRVRAHEPAVLYVESQGLFIAQPVRSGNHRAAQVVDKIGAGDSRRSEKIG